MHWGNQRDVPGRPLIRPVQDCFKFYLLQIQFNLSLILLVQSSEYFCGRYKTFYLNCLGPRSVSSWRVFPNVLQQWSVRGNRSTLQNYQRSEGEVKTLWKHFSYCDSLKSSSRRIRQPKKPSKSTAKLVSANWATISWITELFTWNPAETQTQGESKTLISNHTESLYWTPGPGLPETWVWKLFI